MSSSYEVVIVGGAGRVGAPFGMLLASQGVRTLLHDVNEAALANLAAGNLPFFEAGGEALLRQGIAGGHLGFSSRPADIEGVPYVVVTIGTPVDEFHNPVLRVVTDCVDGLLPHLSDTQTLILRSTIFPGTTEYLQEYLFSKGKRTKVACCPERTAQGHAIEESARLPQIVSGTSLEAERAAAALFSRVAPKVIVMRPKEAELAKLICNAYRYIQFAAANQFYMTAQAHGLDFARIVAGIKEDYPRMRDFPSPGLAAGPCLYKDTLQLAAFSENRFGLGAEAIQVNESLPAFIVSQLRAEYTLREMTIGLLGMSFKAESDDVRASLSYKLKKLLQFHAREVLTTDPFVTSDPSLLPLSQLVERSDLLIVCIPHAAYRDVDFKGKPIVRVWMTDGPRAA